MGESERKEKEAGKLKASRQKETLLMKEMVLQCLVWAFFSQAPIQFTKNYKSKHYYKEKVGRKPKREQKVEKSNGQQEQCQKLEQCTVVKIRKL